MARGDHDAVSVDQNPYAAPAAPLEDRPTGDTLADKVLGARGIGGWLLVYLIALLLGTLQKCRRVAGQGAVGWRALDLRRWARPSILPAVIVVDFVGDVVVLSPHTRRSRVVSDEVAVHAQAGDRARAARLLFAS